MQIAGQAKYQCGQVTVSTIAASTVCMLFGARIDGTNAEMAWPQTIRKRIVESESIRFCVEEQRKYSVGLCSNGLQDEVRFRNGREP